MFADLVDASARCGQGWPQVGAEGRLERLASLSGNVYIFIGESVVESMLSRTKFSRPDDLPVFAVKRTIFLIRTQNFWPTSRPVKSRQFLQ